MRRVLIVVATFVASTGVVFAQQGDIAAFDPTCSPLVHLISQNYISGTTYNTQGLEPEFPIWCYDQPLAGAPTRVRDTEGWVDTWDNDHLAIQTLHDGDYDYRVFPRFVANPVNFKWGAFINTNHWMVDLVDVSTNRLSGGVLISPDQTFPWPGGRLVVEADAAQGAPGMGGADHYYELDVTSATAPTELPNGGVVDALYGYGQFGGVGALGCRLENPALVCSMYDDSNRVTGGQCPSDGRICTDNGGRPGRVWETQGVGTARTAASVRGGFPDYIIPGSNGLRVRDVMRRCITNNTHDLHCRDRFRMELTRDSVHLFANGYLIYAIDGLFAVNPETGADNRIPQDWIDNGARFYMTSWINGGQHVPLRWHWNHVAVNPPYPASEAVSESFCLGQESADGSPNTCPHDHIQGGQEIAQSTTPSPTPTFTPTPNPTSTPTETPTPTVTSTPVPTSTLTPGPTATPPPTATPAPTTCTTVFVRISGFPEQAVDFCK